jgi:hypothetical protein
LFTTAIAQSRRTLAVLHLEADALSRKGMCEDDFAFYAQRLQETEQHLAYLLHLDGVERREEALETARFAMAEVMPGLIDRDPDVYPASCSYCCCELPGYADGTTRWCSEACWEMATAPGYYNAATDPATAAARHRRGRAVAEANAVAERVTGEGYADAEPVDEAAVRRELLAQQAEADLPYRTESRPTCARCGDRLPDAPGDDPELGPFCTEACRDEAELATPPPSAACPVCDGPATTAQLVAGYCSSACVVTMLRWARQDRWGPDVDEREV